MFEQTIETFGILPIPSDVHAQCGIQPFNSALVPRKYAYLAEKQGTRHAVLSVHTAAERKLFNNKIYSDPTFNDAALGKWDTAVVTWNDSVNGVDIFYKVSGWYLIKSPTHTILSSYLNISKHTSQHIRPWAMHAIPDRQHLTSANPRINWS